MYILTVRRGTVHAKRTEESKAPKRKEENMSNSQVCIGKVHIKSFMVIIIEIKSS